jgi:hypothetical protein
MSDERRTPSSPRPFWESSLDGIRGTPGDDSSLRRQCHLRRAGIFFGTIRNEHTRRAYLHAVKLFLAWAEKHGRGELVNIAPWDVGVYFGVRGGEERSHSRRAKAVPTEPGSGAAGAANSMGEDAVKDSIAVSIS